MSIINLQLRMRQIGSIRMGYSEPGRNGGKQPKRSKTWRLTSPDKHPLEVMKSLFGGTIIDFPQGRVDKFCLVTDVTELPVAVTATEETQWMEHWQEGKCVLRCDGCTIVGPRTSPQRGKPCLCRRKYPVEEDRIEAAKKQLACAIQTRVSMMIPDAPDLGLWRLDTKGFYAATELPLTLRFLRFCLARGMAKIDCTLAIEQRKNGEGQPFPVPVIRVSQSVRELEAMRIDGPKDVPLLTSEAKMLSATPSLASLMAEEEEEDNSMFKPDPPELKKEE